MWKTSLLANASTPPDLMATVADLAGTQPPKEIDSISFVPSISAKPELQQPHDYLYWEFYEHGGKQAVRAGNWKAIRAPWMTGQTQLFDLSADIGESNDLAAEHPEQVKRMEAIMADAHRPHPSWQARGRASRR